MNLAFESNNYNSMYCHKNLEKLETKYGEKTVNINLNLIDTVCEKFSNMRNIKIKNLKGYDKDDFKLIVSYVKLLHGTPHYNKLFRIIEKHFKNIEHAHPGTIGGYFGGCLIKTNFSKDNPGCSVVCAGGVPKPDDEEGWSFCDQAVIFAELDNYSRYNFHLLKEPESKDQMDIFYIFIEERSLNDFRGFTAKEINELKNMGVRDFYLIGCDENGSEYIDLYDGKCNIDDVKTVKYIRHIETKSKKKTIINIILTLLIFLLILMLIILYNY